MIALANAPVRYGVFELGAHKGARLPGPEDIAEMVAAAGYAGVDSGPVGMFGRGEELRSRLRRHGLSLAGGWVDLPFADDAAFGDAVASYKQALEFFAEAAAINADMPPKPTLACSGSAERKANPGGGPGLGLTSAQWDHYAANVQRAAEIASAYGLEPTFHHHACTYVESNWSGHLRLPGVSGGELGKGVESVDAVFRGGGAVSYTHLRAHETGRNLVCR